MFSTLLTISAPTGMWATIIGWLSGVGNFAVAIILLTLIIRTVLLPLDVTQRVITTRSSKKMNELKPRLDAINKKFANNPQKRNEETMKVYKSGGANPAGGMIMSIVYMVVSMIIFFTLWSSFRAMSSYKMYEEWVSLENAYEVAYNNSIDEQELGEENYYKPEMIEKVESTEETEETEDETPKIYLNDTAKEAGDAAVLEKYNEVKNSFLWIKNIWGKESSESPVLKYSDFIKNTALSSDEGNENYLMESHYNNVMSSLRAKYAKTWNGYYILPILTAVLTYLSTRMSSLVAMIRAKKKGIPYVDPNGSQKVMTIIMPLFLAIFTIFYTAIFAIYIVAGSIFSLITSPFISLLIEHINYKHELKSRPKKPSYSR